MAFKTKTVGELAQCAGARLIGDPAVSIRGAAGLAEAGPGDISFLANPKYASLLGRTRASAVILSEPAADYGFAQIVAADPYYAFCLVLGELTERNLPPPGVSERAVIGRDVRLGLDVAVLPFVTIGDRCVIGDRVRLFPGVYVGEEVVIGEDSILYPNVTVRERAVLGRRVIIHSGTVIGSDGFGFATHAGRHHKIPQVGTVEIGDDVELGANVAVDRAAMGKTVIARGTKVDNLVQIAHNVTVGEDCLLVSQVGISGSAAIGNRVTLAGQTGVAGHLTIGDGVIAGGRSGVTKDIPSGEIVAGYPAISHRQWLEAQATFSKLPELRKRVKALENQWKALMKPESEGSKEGGSK